MAICAVEGMGGIGKTELALQYAHKYKDTYTAQYWLPIRDKGLAAAVVEKANPYLVLPDELKGATTEAQAEWCWLNWLPAEGNLLVILDDVPNAEAIPEAAMPLDRRIKVLLTTRERMLSSNFEHLTVQVLTQADAEALLTKILTLAGNTEGLSCMTKALSIVHEVCKLVGYLPLGVELIGEYLAKNRHLSFEALRNRLHLADPALAQERKGKLYGYRGVEAAIQLSWDDLNAASKQVGMLLGLFAKAEIPWDLVEAVATRAEINETDLQEAREQLDVLHLIQPVDVECQFYRVHPLVREFFQKQLTEATAINHQFRQAFVQSLLRVSVLMPQTLTSNQIAFVTPAIPHLELLSREMLEDVPNPEKNLLWAFLGIALFYKGQGLYRLALLVMQNCLNAIEYHLGAEHIDVVASLNNLASLYEILEKHGEAESLYKRALLITEKQSGTDLDIAFISNNLAGLYESKGKHKDAEILYLRAITIMRKQLGEDDLNFAECLNGLATVYKSQGKYNESEALFLKSFFIREQKQGIAHPDVAISFNNIGAFYKSQKQYGKAEALYLRALSIWEKELTADHPNIASGLNNLSLLCQAQKKYSEALPLRLRCLEIEEKIFGEEHSQFIFSLNNLVELYIYQENYVEAYTTAQRALVIFQNTLGNQHPDSQNSLLLVKSLQVQILLACDKQTLFSILEALAQQAELPALTTEVALNLLEEICTNPELLHHLQELLSQSAEPLSLDP